MNKLLSVLPLLVFTSTTIQASNLFMEGGLHFGGDELASVQFVGGPTESIDAGGLISGSIGLISDINDTVELRTSIGIKFDLITAENLDMNFTRFPLTAMLFSIGEKVSFGLGATYHLNPTLDISGSLGSTDAEFDDAFGLVAEIDFKLGERGYIGLKATFIDYELNTAFGSSEVSGNSTGIVIGSRF